MKAAKAARRARPADRGRALEGGDPRAVARARAADLGQAVLCLPVVALPVRRSGSPPRSSARSTPRRRSCEAWASASSACAITTGWRASSWPLEEMPRLWEEDRHEAIVRRFRELGYLYVDARPAGLPQRQRQRGARSGSGESKGAARRRSRPARWRAEQALARLPRAARRGPALRPGRSAPLASPRRPRGRLLPGQDAGAGGGDRRGDWPSDARQRARHARRAARSRPPSRPRPAAG